MHGQLQQVSCMSLELIKSLENILIYQLILLRYIKKTFTRVGF